MIIQGIGTVIIVVILVQLITKVVRDKASFIKILFWLFFWGGTLILIWLPKKTLDSFGDIFGVGRGIDALVYLSVIVLFYRNLRLNSKIEELNKKITKIVREVSKISTRGN